MNDPVIFPCREEIKPETEISPEGRAALALAHQEKDAREGLCDYPAPVEEGDDDPEPRRIVGHVGAARVESWIRDESTEETLPEDLPGWPPALAPGTLVSYLHPSWGRVEGRTLDAPREGQVLVQDLTPEIGAREYWPVADLAWEGKTSAATPLPSPPPSSSLSDGGTELLTDHLQPPGDVPPLPPLLPGAPTPALTFYLAYDSSGTRIGQPSGAAGMALSRALDELAETYRDLSELGWGEEAERLDEARADLHLLRVTLSGALTPAALAALTGLDSSDANAIPRAAELLQRLQRESLPGPTPAELARLMCAAVGVGRQQELAQALLAGDETRIRFLQLALLRPGAL